MAGGHEIEAALIVYADTPQAVERRLGDLQTLAGFTLLPRATQTIEDTYFDTRDRSLKAGLIALRIRRLNGTPLLTLKTEPHPLPAGEDRVEIELPWSASALHDVLTELRDRGIGIPSSPSELHSADPADALASLGLREVQARVTSRTPRDVVARGAETRPLAELAIDAVAYCFHDARVRLLEVEVEAKGEGDASTVELITASLHDEFRDQLKLWPYGKFPTGTAIQELLAIGQLDALIGKDGMLRPAAYEQIAGLLIATQ